MQCILVADCCLKKLSSTKRTELNNNDDNWKDLPNIYLFYIDRKKQEATTVDHIGGKSNLYALFIKSAALMKSSCAWLIIAWCLKAKMAIHAGHIST